MFKHDKRRSWRRKLVAVACLGLTAYFAYHAVHGRHGLEARQRLLARAPQIDQQFEVLDSARRRLKTEVALLTPDLPSRDLVEEVAREVLGYVLPSEVLWIGR
jgi:cell division protein FtsB